MNGRVVNYKKFLLFLFLFSFLIRALFFYCFLRSNRNYFTFDSSIHHEVAQNIVGGNGIVRADGSYNFWRVPGYALFLSCCYYIFNSDEIKTMWLHILLSSLIPILIFFLSLALFPAKLLLAKVSSIYSAIHLGYVLFSGFMMTESLFCIFFFLFLLLFLQRKHIFFAGICLGVATLIRPVGQYLLIFLFVMIIFDRLSFTGTLKRMVALLVGWVFPVLLWLLRNYVLTGAIFFHTLPGNHFLYYVAVPIDMNINGCSSKKSAEHVFGKLSDMVAQREKMCGRRLQEIERCALAEKLARSYIFKRPVLVIKNALYNMIKTCVAFYSSHILAISDYFPKWCYEKGVTVWDMLKKYLVPPVDNIYLKISIWLELFFSAFILLGFCLGLFRVFFDRNLLYIMLRIFPIMAGMIFLTFASGIARLRLPVEPFFIIFSWNFWLYWRNEA